jgi:uncharacterized protein with von Willebrand factor type A (vWA) domain
VKRIIFDVPRWSIYLHRRARGLDSVDHDDPAWRQLEDELFEKLYSGSVDLLAEGERTIELSSWAEKLHAACDELPEFSRLAAECKGDADAAATGVESIMAQLAPKMQELSAKNDSTELRRVLRATCGRAAEAVEDLRDAVDGLDGVALGNMPGTGSGHDGTNSRSGARTLAQRLKHDDRLKRIALLAGRFKRIGAAKRRSKVRHGADEIMDVEQGGDLGRLLPAELVKLGHPRFRLAALRALVERQALQYRMEGTEVLGRGPLVVCLDKSGSMDGPPDLWATAVALALLGQAQHEHRPFALLGFDGALKSEHVVGPGAPLPWEALFTGCSGGTNIDRVIDRALEIIATHQGALRRADVVLITDGASSADQAESLRTRAVTLGVSVLGVGIGIDAASLKPWCGEAVTVTDLDRLDDTAAEHLFST